MDSKEVGDILPPDIFSYSSKEMPIVGSNEGEDPLHILPWPILTIMVEYLGHGLSHYYGLVLNIPREGSPGELLDLGHNEEWKVDYSCAFIDDLEFYKKYSHPMVVWKIFNLLFTQNRNMNSLFSVVRGILMTRNGERTLEEGREGSRSVPAASFSGVCGNKCPLPAEKLSPILCTAFSPVPNSIKPDEMLFPRRALILITLTILTFRSDKIWTPECIDEKMKLWKEYLQNDIIQHPYSSEEITWRRTILTSPNLIIFSKHNGTIVLYLYIFVSGETIGGVGERTLVSSGDRVAFFSDALEVPKPKTKFDRGDIEFLVKHLSDNDIEALGVLTGDTWMLYNGEVHSVL